ncbi:MAG TPA: tetratricopeptide repeat protein [Anaeromyxobacteraceae bacterium]|nr:tetratricopeptide repeat protein [Anaeromyxobacteraceae bacterium]
MRRAARALAALLFAAPTARAATPRVAGDFDSPLGRVRIAADGARFRGTLLEPAPGSPFRRGEEVLRATLLDDSLAGEVRVWLAGEGCTAREEWGNAVLLAAGDRLSGAVHVAAKGCKGPLGKNGGIVLERVVRRKGAASPSPGEAALRRERARAVMREGASHLSVGEFEAARRRFLEAIEIDRTVPEAYNGVGVTYRMRNDLTRALAYYKKALGVDPDFGDAYYNIACVYALRGEKALALRYLQIAAQNGYATAEGIDQDPDLEALRAEPAYRALVRARM